MNKPPYITMFSANGVEHDFTEEEFLSLKNSGMMWEKFPDAPDVYPTDYEEIPVFGYRINTCSPVYIETDQMLLRDIEDHLQVGVENTQELLVNHDLSLGRTTRKNRLEGERLENEIREMQESLEKVKKLLTFS